MRQKRTTKKGAFLAAFSKLGNITSASKTAKCSRTEVYRWLKEDADFAASFDTAQTEAMEHLEAEAHRRAVTGTLKPVFHQGVQCGQIREFSDTLLIFLMKAGNPLKYRENKFVEHGGSVGHKHSGEVTLTMQAVLSEVEQNEDIAAALRQRATLLDAGTDGASLLTGQVAHGATPGPHRSNGNGHHSNGNGSHSGH